MEGSPCTRSHVSFGGKGPEKQLWFLGTQRLGVGGWVGRAERMPPFLVQPCDADCNYFLPERSKLGGASEASSLCHSHPWPCPQQRLSASPSATQNVSWDLQNLHFNNNLCIQ